MIEKVLCIDDDNITLVLCEVVIKNPGLPGKLLQQKTARKD